MARVHKEFDLALMFITHDLATVRAVADDIVVMQYGRIVEKGSAGDVLFNPSHPYTARLPQSVPDIDPDWLNRQIEKRHVAQ